jgi:type II secretory pathway component PulM
MSRLLLLIIAVAWLVAPLAARAEVPQAVLDAEQARIAAIQKAVKPPLPSLRTKARRRFEVS